MTNLLLLLPMVLGPFAYFILMVIVRWHAVAVPTRRLAQAQIEGLRQRWKQECVSPATQDAEEQALGERIERLLEQAETVLSDSILEKLLWPRGAELQAWRLIHDAESLIALVMDQELAKEKLAQIQPKSAQDPVSVPPARANNSTNNDIRKRLYWELRRSYDEKDTNFARLSTTHAKIAWLTYVGLVLVGLFLALGPGHLQELPAWMLFGALGALLSRCLRFLKATQLPTEYGVYWILLFLAPVYGALAGIAGVLLFHLLVEMKILSSDTFGSLSLNQAAGMYGRFALAALAGLSERWLDQLITQVEEKSLQTLQKEKETSAEEPPRQDRKQDDPNKVWVPGSRAR
ncbi:hypothetical protein [Chloroflexus sp.]|uniref:hypothetical protein n=1 Tax=Chloroflexus sp. TaxID=1904827 RepID=UPI003D0EE96E